MLSTSITRELTAQVLAPLDGPGELEIDLRYDTADPYAVHAVFHVSVDRQISWVFARELLADGMTAPSGDGDVRIWPTSHDGHQVVCIVLRSPDGEALLQAQAVQVDEFLSAAYSLCARGREARHLQIDRGLVALFAS